MADLEYTARDGVATIMLNRPHRKNAFTFEMIDRWVEALEHAQAAPDVRAILITGAGDAFCSGVDLDQRNAGHEPTPLGRRNMLTHHVHRIPRLIERIDVPVVAAINGVAVGAGLDMALMCDVRLMAESATVWEGYVLGGILPGDGGCYYLPRIVGTARALELLWTGRRVSSQEALELGLVNHVYGDDEFAARIHEFMQSLVERPPEVIRLIKRTVYQSLTTDLSTSLDLIAAHTGVVAFMEDTREAAAAFREKRRGTYSGR